MAERCSGESLSALARPPLSPPVRPRVAKGDNATFSGESATSPVARSAIAFASWFGSRGRLGCFAMGTILHQGIGPPLYPTYEAPSVRRFQNAPLPAR